MSKGTPIPTTDERILKWKVQHCRVFQFDIGGVSLYFKKPDMRTLGAVSRLAERDPMQALVVMYQNTLLNKEEGMKYKDDVDFMSSIGPYLEGLVEKMKVEVKEL